MVQHSPTGKEPLSITSHHFLLWFSTAHFVEEQKSPETKIRYIPESKTHALIKGFQTFNVKNLFSLLIISQRYLIELIQWYYITEQITDSVKEEN